jgi:hypothetical protein
MANGFRHLMRSGTCAGFVLVLLAQSALAGPPYISDDPEPTDYQHFEIYTYSLGTARPARAESISTTAPRRIFS